jgi:hypothetical protein
LLPLGLERAAGFVFVFRNAFNAVATEAGSSPGPPRRSRTRADVAGDAPDELRAAGGRHQRIEGFANLVQPA